MNYLLKRNDKQYKITYSLVNDDGSIPNLTNASVIFNVGNPTKILFTKPAVIDNAGSGIVSYTLLDEDTMYDGLYRAEFVVTFQDGTKMSYPRNGYISINIQKNVDTSLSNMTLDAVAERQGDFTNKLASILQQAGNITMSTMNEYTWTSNAGQLTYVMPTGANYDPFGKWFEVYVGNAIVPPSLIDRSVQNQFTLLVSSSSILAGLTVIARWTEPIVPVTVGHHTAHELNGADEIDITKLRNFDTQVTAPLAEMARNPIQYGADATGVVDGTASINMANNINGNVLISTGKFRVSQNTHLGHVHFLNGGTITVDSGIVLTIDAVRGDPATVIFKGAGTVVTSDNRYSVGWFEGNYFNEKWDFCKRAWRSLPSHGVGVQKYVHVPTPKAGDPACGASIAAPQAWKINSPVTFGFYDDNLIFDSEAVFNVVAACAGFVFSPHNTGEETNYNKTDEIRFPKGLNVEGGLNPSTPIGTDGIVINEGARIIFDGGVRAKLFSNTGVTITPLEVEAIEVVFNFLEVTGFGNYGLVIGKQSATNSNTVPSQIVIRYLFSNGGLNGSQAFALIAGQVRNISIDKFVEYIATGTYYDVSDGQIVIQSTTAGYPLRINLKDLYSYVSTKPIVKSYNNGGSTKVSDVSIEKFTANVASILVNLAYTSSSTIKGVPQSAGSGSIVIGSDCDHVDIETNRNTIISGNCPQLMLNKKYFANYALANQTAQAIPFDSNVNGFVDIVAKEDATNCATILIRNGGAIVNQTIGSNVTTQSGTVLTGTTGTAGKVNLSYVNNTLYIENQIGSTRTFVVHGLTY